MPKLEINQVAEIIKKHHVEPATLRAIVEDMNLATQPEPGEESAPAVKKQFVFIISDPHGTLPKQDYVGWVVKIPESDSPATTIDRLNRACYDYNSSRRGRLFPVNTHGEALETVPTKFLKQAELWAATKTPVLVIKTNNEIPREKNTSS